jgi:hypothetical protein
MSKVLQLQSRAAALPEHLAAEVLDFLEFVTAKRTLERTQRSEAVSRFKGAFKGRLSTASEFAARKADERRLER